MITLDEYVARLKAADNGLKNALLEFVTNINSASIDYDLKARIQDRIESSGETASGKKHKYSTKPILVNQGSFRLKSAAQKAAQKADKWVTLKNGSKRIVLFEITGGYEEFRELNNLQTDFVDATFTKPPKGNSFWVNARTPARIEQDRIIIDFEVSNNKEAEGKFLGILKRYGADFVLPNKDDENFIINRIYELINKYV